MRSGVTPKGGSSLTKLALAMRERSLSGSGWKERMLYNYRRGTQSIFYRVIMNEKQEEVLRIAQEECAEVIQAISKVFRFGLHTEHNGKTNQSNLTDEVGDLLCMIELFSEFGVLDKNRIKFCALKKREKLEKWSSIFKNEIEEYREAGII